MEAGADVRSSGRRISQGYAVSTGQPVETNVRGVPAVVLTEDSLSLSWDDMEITVTGADGRKVAQAIAYVLLEAAFRE